MIKTKMKIFRKNGTLYGHYNLAVNVNTNREVFGYVQDLLNKGKFPGQKFWISDQTVYCEPDSLKPRRLTVDA